jgi:hypothetical protein
MLSVEMACSWIGTVHINAPGRLLKSWFENNRPNSAIHLLSSCCSLPSAYAHLLSSSRPSEFLWDAYINCDAS